ncbi:invasion associated locus B family protein [Pleomorphomonas sp. NRK KF1]|uniref:invasion associated locus B family protein n=1 Tax=Pleomorphomonas sp. NRK KF1 TaxID=2943000 RepID=UPI002043D6E0|nr:invasion associated locus B family protein [Pleomorphomonas sp. NRK KF1]MCM5555294.1 invasion associated locus B family protein [Pleomorphomonas sp. NRK KF1]
MGSGRRTSGRLTLALAVAVGLAPGDLRAETQPQESTATYGDWVLHCTRSGLAASADADAKADAAPTTSCEIVQTIVADGGAAPVARLAFGYQTLAADQMMVTAVLPVNVSLPGRVGVFGTAKTGADAGPGLALSFRRCVPGGCFAQADAEASLVAAAKKEKTGALRFIDAQGRTVAITLSWTGFAAALAALEGQKADKP